jgi:hypothetical protein
LAGCALPLSVSSADGSSVAAALWGIALVAQILLFVIEGWRGLNLTEAFAVANIMAWVTFAGPLVLPTPPLVASRVAILAACGTLIDTLLICLVTSRKMSFDVYRRIGGVLWGAVLGNLQALVIYLDWSGTWALAYLGLSAGLMALNKRLLARWFPHDAENRERLRVREMVR